MTNKIEELGKVLMEIDALNDRLNELETIKDHLKFAITIEQRELQMVQAQQAPQNTPPESELPTPDEKQSSD